MKIKEVVKAIKARQTFTSRSTPTVEVEFCMDGFSIFSSVPTGKSTGAREAKVLLDGTSEYDGGSVMNVVNNILAHASMVLDTEVCAPDLFDYFLLSLDGTKDKSKLGANFLLPLSICYRKLHAYLHKEPLYRQFIGACACGHSRLEINNNTEDNKKGLVKKMPIANFNVLNGGLHTSNGLDCQEIMVCFEREEFAHQMHDSVTFFKALGRTINKTYQITSIGDEGGYCPPFKNIHEALDLLMQVSIETSIPIRIGLDPAANSFYKGNGMYKFDGKDYSGKELGELYESLVDQYPIYLIEDPFAEDDIPSWEIFNQKMGNRIIIVADDLTVTNIELIEKYKALFNAVLIKPNQIGTVAETLSAINLCRKLNYKIMISHRSAETEDTFIADLAVGAEANFIKSGAPHCGERICKYNQLMRIEEDLKQSQGAK